MDTTLLTGSQRGSYAAGARSRDGGEFEAMLADWMGVSHAVPVQSGALAGLAALAAMGLGAKDHIVLSPFCSPSIAQAIVLLGASATIVDSAPLSPHMDASQVAAAVKRRTRAIVVPHVSGSVAPLDDILDIAHDHRLVVVEDVGALLGCQHFGFPVGSLGHVAVAAFEDCPALGRRSGGAIATNIDTLAERTRTFVSGGVRSGSVEVPGLDCALREWDDDALLSAGGVLRHLTWIVDQYRHALDGDWGIQIPAWFELDGPKTELSVRLDVEAGGATRDEIASAIASLALDLPRERRPLPLQPFFQRALRWSPDAAPNARRWCQRTISVPVWPDMTEDDVMAVAGTIRERLGG